MPSTKRSSATKKGGGDTDTLATMWWENSHKTRLTALMHYLYVSSNSKTKDKIKVDKKTLEVLYYTLRKRETSDSDMNVLFVWNVVNHGIIVETVKEMFDATFKALVKRLSTYHKMYNIPMEYNAASQDRINKMYWLQVMNDLGLYQSADPACLEYFDVLSKHKKDSE